MTPGDLYRESAPAGERPDVSLHPGPDLGGD